MKLIYTILLVATSIGCWAKGIRGTIVDEIGQPTPFVNVVLMSDSTFIDGKVTDDTGGLCLKMLIVLPTRSKYP